MAESIKTAVNAFYAEYSAYPTNSSGQSFTNTSKDFFTLMTTTNTNGVSAQNTRGIAFLEVPPKFTNDVAANGDLGLVPPKGYGTKMTNFYIQIDSSGLGYVDPTKSSGTRVTNKNVPSTVAVWADDPTTKAKAVGTFK